MEGGTQEQDEQLARTGKRRRWILLVLVLFGAAGVAFLRRPTLTKEQARFVGTWKYSSDKVPTESFINIREDGSARWRRSSKTKCGYLRWNVEGDQFFISQYSSQRAARIRTLLTPVFGPYQANHYDIVRVNENEFVLHGTYKDYQSGEMSEVTITYRRTIDEATESAE